MRRGLAASLGLLAATAACAAPVVDAARHSVTFTAKATGLKKADKAEFFFVTPGSDHDYESVFKLDDTAKDMIAALKAAGIPKGRNFDVKSSRLWPAGVVLTMEPAITNFIRDAYGEAIPQIVYSGGADGEKGIPLSDYDSPCAFLALYNCPQSQLQLDDSLEQSATYGRFLPAREFQPDESVQFTLTWNGEESVKPVDLKLAPGKIEESVSLLKKLSEKSELDVTPDFSSEMTLREASAFAEVFRMLDSPRVKMNGFKEGQFYYQAYLPLEKWRDRKERLSQPPEIHFSSDKIIVTEIVEDWSDEESLDPKLIIKNHTVSTAAEAAAIARPFAEKTFTAFIYAPDDFKLAGLFELKKHLKSDLIWNWYVFPEKAPQEK